MKTSVIIEIETILDFKVYISAKVALRLFWSEYPVIGFAKKLNKNSPNMASSEVFSK